MLCNASWALRAAFLVKKVTKQHPAREDKGRTHQHSQSQKYTIHCRDIKLQDTGQIGVKGHDAKHNSHEFLFGNKIG